MHQSTKKKKKEKNTCPKTQTPYSTKSQPESNSKKSMTYCCTIIDRKKQLS